MIASGVKKLFSSQSLYPTYECILLGAPLLQSAILGPRMSHSIPRVGEPLTDRLKDPP